VKRSIPQRLARRKQKIKRRLARLRKRNAKKTGFGRPVMNTGGLKYDLSDRDRGCVFGGVPLIVKIAQRVGLVDAIDRHVQLLKIHLPYHESDHVLNFAINALCEGTCIEDIELRRNDEAFLDALGAETIPDPTTAGDFCRRFRTDAHVRSLLDAIDESRLNVWKEQPSSFFDRAVIDMDGVFAITLGECKQGMDISYKNDWGYHPLIVSLANTKEVLSLVNRSGNRPSHEGAAAEADRAAALCRRAGFRKIVFRGDTDFSQTAHLDRWNADGITFYFGYDRTPNLCAIANDLPESRWKPLVRPPKYEAVGPPREKPSNVKRQVIRRREFLHLELESEEVAVFKYRPVACKQTYRMIVVRKNISREKGELRLLDEIRYHFYITNDRQAKPAEVVFECNDRCDQENLIAQLAGGVKAIAAPVDNLYSNWAYMVMTSLAWTLKSWTALLVPVHPRWKERHETERRTLLTMEFKTFVNVVVKLPCQIVTKARQTVVRLLSWTPWLPVFFRLCDELRC
jgi:hypothetical protein